MVTHDPHRGHRCAAGVLADDSLMHILTVIATVIVIAVTVIAVLLALLWWAMNSKDGMR